MSRPPYTDNWTAADWRKIARILRLYWRDNSDQNDGTLSVILAAAAEAMAEALDKP